MKRRLAHSLLRSVHSQTSQDKSRALEQTKQYALQSLASVAYQIDTLAKVRASANQDVT